MQGGDDALSVACAIDAARSALVASVAQFAVIVPTSNAGEFVTLNICAGGDFNLLKHGGDLLFVSVFVSDTVSSNYL